MAAANLPTVAPRAVFADITGTVNQEMTDSAGAYIRKTSMIARAIQRKRVVEKGYPSIPKTYSDLDNITDKLSSTTQQTKTREEHKIIWFISLERPVNIP